MQIVLDTIKRAVPSLRVAQPEVPPLDVYIPTRTRTQCIGCSYRGILHALKRVVRKTKGVVVGDIGCHDAGSFKPMELQSTIYCMGSSIPMATGMHYAGIEAPIFAFIGDSTFYHNGIMGLISAANQKANITIILGENQVTAMTGYQPHPGTGELITGEPTGTVDVQKLAEALGISYRVVNPYDIRDCRKALEESVKEEGVSLVVSAMPCYLLSARKGRELFEAREIRFDEERCNGCMICIQDFGCPAISYNRERKKISIDSQLCVGCGLCIDVCKRGAIS